MDLASEQTIKEMLRKHDIRPVKQLGQSFLVDKLVLKKIIQAAELKKDDIVLEIGSGLGTLTMELAKRVKKVIAIEKDKKLYDLLKEILKNYKNIEVINADILDLGMQSLSDRLGGRTPNNAPNKIVSNLPYYIASPVIRKFLEAENKPKSMILMIQKEVARRIIARPPNMSILSIAVQSYANPEIIDYVSKSAFYPTPKVDSAIIKITPYVRPRVSHINSVRFFRLVKAGFSSKRKQLANSLSRELCLNKKVIKTILEKSKIDIKIRPQNLDIKDWLKIYENYKIYKS